MAANPRVSDLADSLAHASDRFARMLEQVSDPSLPAIGVWNIGETANHVAGSAPLFLQTLRGEMELVGFDELDALHARELERDPERDPHVLAERVREGVAELITYARGIEGDPTVQVFGGVEVPFSTVLAIELAEKLVHGLDIARPPKIPWHIEPIHAVHALEGFIPLFPLALDKERAADTHLRFELRIRGGPRVFVEVEQGELRVERAADGPLDFHLSVDPVAYLLLTFNRTPPWRQMLAGKLVAWGRRPWAAGKFQRLMNSP